MNLKHNGLTIALLFLAINMMMILSQFYVPRTNLSANIATGNVTRKPAPDFRFNRILIFYGLVGYALPGIQPFF